jgi:hypothetical protein
MSSRTASLEVVRPAEYAAWQKELEALEVWGWRFRPGDSHAVVVGERVTKRGDQIKHFAPSVKRLVADINDANERN